MKPKNVCIVGSAQRLYISAFWEGGGGGAPGLVDTSTGKFHREGRGNGRSVPVKCKSMKWGWKKGRCKAKHVENGKTN